MPSNSIAPNTILSKVKNYMALKCCISPHKKRGPKLAFATSLKIKSTTYDVTIKRSSVMSQYEIALTPEVTIPTSDG